jgi:hypothetical protein
MSKLDRSKPFGEVFGGHPARFEQDGKFFNSAGDEIEIVIVEEKGEDGKLVPVQRAKPVGADDKPAAKPAGKKQTAKAAAPVEETQPADPVDDQLAAQLGDGDASFE